MQRRRLQPKNAAPLRGAACQAVHVQQPGAIVFCAGQVAFDAERRVIGKDDIRAQTRCALQNLEAVLKEAGGDLTHVVKLNTFVTNFDLLPGVLEARAEFPLRDFAASTVQVSRLVDPDLLIEIEAIAVLP